MPPSHGETGTTARYERFLRRRKKSDSKSKQKHGLETINHHAVYLRSRKTTAFISANRIVCAVVRELQCHHSGLKGGGSSKYNYTTTN